jgi:RNA polymerase sigma-70 factor (ECF subfamily)
VEKRAYRTALFTCRSPADALDIVQDTMMQLVQHHRARPAPEWPLLFQRILQNRIMDWHRQQSSRRKWFWQSPTLTEELDGDILDHIADTRDINPENLLERARDVDMVLAAIENLPLRQRQAFLLRLWEGLDVAETASAMQCSEGAVKSHLFRALQSIKQALGEDS